MESRAFIKAATSLIAKIGEVRTMEGIVSPAETRSQRENVQKEISSLFSGLQNPTLPSAYKLRDAAQEEGYALNPKIMQQLAHFENLV